ncbi:MAG: hypothetical protein KatS3mg035_1762 [Bacteroidia bacterium]|nr:MAG: hypothetical protein KatS3mg035_1762 [Bacteroidia bacterium]
MVIFIVQVDKRTIWRNRVPKNKKEAKTQKDIEKEANMNYSGQSVY